MMSNQIHAYPIEVQKILSLFQTMPIAEKRQVLDVLAEDFTAEMSALSPLERILKTQQAPVITDISQLAADLWADDAEFEAFLAWQAESRELGKRLSEERFQRIFGEDVQ